PWLRALPTAVLGGFDVTPSAPVKLYAAALLAFFFAPVPTNHGATIDAPQLPCAYDDKVCAWKVAQAHPVFTRNYWQASFDKPLEERIGAASPELIEFLHLGT